MRVNFEIVMEMVALEDEVSRHEELMKMGAYTEITEADYAAKRSRLNLIYKNNPDLYPCDEDGAT